MRDIARLAGGVHPSTVSLALRNDPSISLATRKRIHAVAKSAGYRRDPMLDAFNARRLVTTPHRLQSVIALVACFDSHLALTKSPQHAALWRGATIAAQSLHCHLESFPVGNGGLTAERLDSVLHARGIDCLITAALPAEIAQLHVTWDRYSAVKIDCFDWKVPNHTIAADLRQAVRMAVNNAADLGYRHLGLAMNRSREKERNDLLHAGYLIEQSGNLEASSIPPLLLDERLDVRAIKQWIRSHKIDAVLSDSAGFGDVVGDAGFAETRRIAWACLDVTTAVSEIAGVILPHERVGALAVEQVVSLARTNQRGIMPGAATTLVPVAWRDGMSMPRRASR